MPCLAASTHPCHLTHRHAGAAASPCCCAVHVGMPCVLRVCYTPHAAWLACCMWCARVMMCCAHTGMPPPLPQVRLDTVTHEDPDWTVPGWTASRCGGYCDDSWACACAGRGPSTAASPRPTAPPAVGEATHQPMPASCGEGAWGGVGGGGWRGRVEGGGGYLGCRSPPCLLSACASYGSTSACRCLFTTHAFCLPEL